MKKQLLFIHGGSAYLKHKDFLEYLSKRKYDPFLEYPDGWSTKKNLEKSLGEEWMIIRPLMPNKQNAKYQEWKIWFERQLDFFDDGFVLIGHSLGAMFLVRYLSEEVIETKPSKIFLLAGAAEYKEVVGEDGGDFFAKKAHFKNIPKIDFEVFLYHSQDDFVVPFKNLEIFSKNIPEAKIHVFKDRGHFLQEEFPELIKNIKDN